MPGGVGQLGLILFVYCVGITAGPSFFRVFVRQGKQFAKLGVALVGFGALATWFVSNIFRIPSDLASGMSAGALTSTSGLAAGTLLGSISFGLGSSEFSLGMAGGPLFVALVLGHFGRVGPVVGHLPRASGLLLMEIGLVLFLASAGVHAGEGLVPAFSEYGLSLCVASVVAVFSPMLVEYLFAEYLLKMNLLQIIGGVCGGMTSTPGLVVITAKTDSDIPIVSYAAAYPVALLLMTVFARLLVSVLS